MGTVWLAEDSLLKRDVAIKEIDIPPGFDREDREGLEARLLREARAAARLSHSGVVSVYDVVEHSDRPWIVMEYVDAPTLDEIVKENGPLSPEEGARIGIELCNILEVAHSEGIIHRDVKPANVMCTDAEHVKLADFGIASVQDDPKITQTGLVLGSPSFMAPEQASKGVSGPEADLWSLGATLYQSVEGEAPFDRGSALPTLTAVMTENPRPMQRAGSLAPVISALLRKEPSDRPSLAETRSLLQAIVDGPNATVGAAPTIAATAPAAPATAKSIVAASPITRQDRNWWPWVALAVGLVALIAIPLLISGPDEPTGNDEGRRSRANQGSAQGENDTGSGAGAVTAPEGELPEDWTTYTDPGSGYSIGYPSDWEIVSRAENTLDFTDPSTGTYLRVAWTDAPGDDVMARLEEIEGSFAGERDAYQQLQMTPTDFQGHEAGLWEYTYEEGGAALHAYNLQFVVAETYGFALNFQTHEEDWTDSQDLWETFQATFEAPSA